MVRTSVQWLRPLALCLAVSFLAVSPTAAGEGEDLEALEARFEKVQKDEGARAAHEALLPDFEAFAKEHAGTADGLGAELWLLRMHWWKRSEGTMEKDSGPHARRLVREYGAYEQMVRIPEFSYLFSADDFEEICRELVEVSPHREVRAGCLFARAKKRLRQNPEEARVLFRELKKSYADVPYRYITFGEIAEAQLNPHARENLKVGEVAPDIVGVDVNGAAMRLSDYRGKVVVLDFWGDW